MAVPEKDGSGPPSAEASADLADAPVLAIQGKIGPLEIADLCLRVRESFALPRVRVVIVDVSGVVDPDVAALDALARLHLTAKRMGREIKIRHTCRQLRELTDFSGLSGVLLGCPESQVDPGD